VRECVMECMCKYKRANKWYDVLVLPEMQASWGGLLGSPAGLTYRPGLVPTLTALCPFFALQAA
jgi:hypothetical protein